MHPSRRATSGNSEIFVLLTVISPEQVFSQSEPAGISNKEIHVCLLLS